MSSMGELTFFLGLQVKQKPNGIFISQDKYVAEILRNFCLTEGKSASTPIDTKKPLHKDLDDKFWKKTWKKISIQGSDVAVFDKSKVECFNCHKMGYFARECRALRSQDRGRRDNYRQGSKAEEQAPKALMAIDGAHSYANRPVHRTSAVRSPYRALWVPTVNRNYPPVNIKFSTGSRNFPTANRKFPTVSRKFPTGSTKSLTADMGRKGKAGSSQNKIDDKGYWDSGCSRHMTGNISYLSDYEPFDGGYVSFVQGGCKITGKGTIKTECIVLGRDFKFLDDANILLRTPRQHNMYSIDLNNIVPHIDLTCLVAKASADECMLWHRRLGHLNFKTMNELVRHNLVRGLPTNFFENDHTCTACLKGKQHKAYCKSKLVNSMTKYLHTLHMDLFGPTSVSSISHKWYCIVVTDDFSRFTWNFFLKSKDETSGILKKFITEIENLKDLKVKIIRCNNGGEFRNKEMNDFCSQKGIKREFSNARIRQQNGVAERRNRTLIEAARTMLANAKLPVTFWAEAVNTACYVQNRVLVNKSHNKTPYELFNSRSPAIGFLKLFGCHVMILNTLYNLGKFEEKGDEGYFIGYSMSSKAFRVFNKRTRRVEENLHVEFLENKAIKKGSGPNCKPQDHCSTKVPEGSENPNPTTSTSNPPADQMETLTVETPIPTNVWTLVNCPKRVRPIGTKWVLKNKKDEREIVIRNKSRLVAQGHTQKEGIDYDEVCAPVVRIEAIRLFLAYSSLMGFIVYQMDVKSAFLYGTIDEEVFSMPCKALSKEFSSSILR
nr:hypothetical protein [Tanacetum cinerariifolium]